MNRLNLFKKVQKKYLNLPIERKNPGDRGGKPATSTPEPVVATYSRV